uniref:Uncharacterized protein n=1 Tax=Anguilla anguilla TaxID=7936 RepID=A0A0E9Y2Q1_ANGAN
MNNQATEREGNTRQNATNNWIIENKKTIN